MMLKRSDHADVGVVNRTKRNNGSYVGFINVDSK